MQAKNLSSVKGFKFSNIFKKIDSKAVPKIALIKKCLPFFTKDIIKRGIFKISTVVPNGILNK